MKAYIYSSFITIAFFIVITSCKNDAQNLVETETTAVTKQDPLPSWNDVESKKNIIAYIEDVTNSESTNFIPVADRISTFDNDGNLWSEQPAYFQLFFAIDRVKAMAKEHPE